MLKRYHTQPRNTSPLCRLLLSLAIPRTMNRDNRHGAGIRASIFWKCSVSAMPERPAQWASAKITVAPDNSITKGNHRMPTVDDLLCSATESQLRNVLAMLNLSESELN